ncbi:hypothetical protein INT46_005041 [Mucor plumbeus]|uniref:Ubiquitin-like protease family profile domain-containing protein n=1 Tax=Mucor plumbeus TaxID=97098 RepID=A0A8H7R226_9FUNG|nr:hypothetical protein INT46_005041 [Mucor plumbeus]
MKKKQKKMANDKHNANSNILKTSLSSEMPGTFPLPSPPTTPTMIVLDSDSDDEKEDDNDDNDSKKAINEENQIIFTTTNKISLTDRDLQTLQPGKWLNDTIVDFSLKIIQDRNKYSDYSFVSSSFFFTRLRLAKENNLNIYKETKAWINCQKLRQSRIWFIPVCQKYHWFLIAVVFPGKESSLIYVMDSLNMNRLSEAKIIIDFLKSKSLAETRKPLQKVPEIYQHKIPQQHNMNDCGLHLIRSFELSIIRRKFIISLMRGEITDQSRIDAFWHEYPVISRLDLEYQLLKYAMDHSAT